jgi:predicted nucleotidyltransferase
MDKEQALALARQYAEKVRNEIHPDQIILFGSYATDGATHDCPESQRLFFP